jgi:hypothetical protein
MGLYSLKQAHAVVCRLQGNGYPIGLLLAAQGSGFIQVLAASPPVVRGGNVSLSGNATKQSHNREDKVGILGKSGP